MLSKASLGLSRLGLSGIEILPEAGYTKVVGTVTGSLDSGQLEGQYEVFIQGINTILLGYSKGIIPK